ncbi:MAG: non-ribosomal peptide synthetase, partial [Bacteroidales bacterium]|nr:non-ribosomal peptide synthetase [Bacteroidales bacterium]
MSHSESIIKKAAILLTQQLFSLDDIDCFWTDETPLCELIEKCAEVETAPVASEPSDNYPEELIANAKKTYEHIFEQLRNAPEGLTVGQLSYCTEPQLAEARRLGKGDEVAYDASKTVVDLFRIQAEKTPSATAIVAGSASLTYSELDELSDRVAKYLIAKGLGKEDAVSIIIPRTEMMAVCSVGVLKAGLTYQPLDPSYPVERLNFMMKDAKAKFLIAERGLRPLVNEYEGEVLFTDEIRQLPALTAEQKADVIKHAPEPEDRYILLYTSGSTGVPKGCELCHFNLTAFLAAAQEILHYDENSKVTAYASYGFDANMFDLYPALTHGGTIHVIGEDIRYDLDALNDYFEKVGITHAFMTTQVARAYATGNIPPKSLKHLSCGGETLVPFEPSGSYQMHNVYGPTETTIFVTEKVVDKLYHRIPIGRAISNVALSIIDKNKKPLPAGALGELVITGPQVSRGYLNRPEKTAEVFLDAPNGEWSSYRTGDIARLLPNGEVDFIGRRDGQVKIRGFRVELSEVEKIIREFKGIQDATVQAFDDPAGGKFITAYIVSDEKIDVAALNAFIAEQKPPYMVPATTMQIDKIPLNQNQKVDRKKLPVPQIVPVEEVEDNDRPLNVLEQDIKDCIVNLLGNDNFSATTPLRHLGLTSISSIRLASDIFKHFNVKFSGKELVADGTIAYIADKIIEERIYSHKEEAVKTKAKVDVCPLSNAQFGVYIDSVNNPTAILYNTPLTLTFAPSVTADRLEKALKAVFAAHSYVQCHFEMRDGEVVQVAGDDQTPVARYEAKDEEVESLCDSLILPFSVQNDKKLYRAAIITSESSTTLFLDMHHLIVDGTSANIIIKELIDALNGNAIEKEEYTY